MSDYKLVPVEITDEMAEASGCEGCFRKSVHDQAQDTWTAMLAAAPAPVERNQCDGCQAGIPVERGMHRMGRPGGYTDMMACTADRYGSEPTVQGEPVAWQRVDRPERIITVLSRRTWKESDDDVEFRALYTAPQPAEQKPAPDVSALVEALESAKNLIANHSGEMLPDEYAGDQIEQIDAALSAYRKGGDI